MHRERIDTVGKLQVHCQEAGAGEPVVFLHGWSQHAASSTHIREMLTHRYHVLSPSHIGFGKSSALPHNDFSLADFGQVYGQWLVQRGLTNVTLVGHSLGGAIAQVITALAPAGTIKRLVIIDTLGVPFQRTEMQWTWLWLQKEVRNLMTAPKRHAQFLVTPFINHLFTRPGNLFTLSALSKQLDVQEYAKQIRVPAEIIWGEGDTFVPRSVGERLQQIISGSTFVTIPGGHDWPLLEPEKLLPFLV
jgi:pimeloyl-ACP methyl ester carboxylesterase